MNRLSIRGRLVLWLGCVVAALLVSFALFFYGRLENILYANFDELLLTRATVIASGYEPGRGSRLAAGSGRGRDDDNRPRPAAENPAPGDPAAPAGSDDRRERGRGRDDNRGREWRERRERDRRPPELLTAVLARGRMHQGDYCVIVTGSDRRLVECSQPGREREALAFPLPVAGPRFFNYSRPGSGAERFLALPFATAEGEFILYVGQPLSRVDDSLARVALWLAVALPLTVLLITGGIWLLTTRGLAPLQLLNRDAAAIDGSDLARRLTVPATGDEVASLARSFNATLDRIATATERVRQFTADAAHELRTPLAGLKGRVQVALRRERSAADYHALLTDLETDARGLEHLLEGLLLLARLDHSGATMPVADLDLHALVAAVAAEPASAALRVTSTVPAGFTLRANATLLTQLFRNLFDNAGKYAGPAAAVTIGAARRDGRAVLTVTDDGPGVPPETLARLFDTFYKVDDAHTARGSAGLGLSIVAAIARAHDAAVRAENMSPRGLKIEITF